MHKLFVFGLFIIVYLSLLIAPNAYAVNGGVVIYQVQAGAPSSIELAATKEFISIYNNSDNNVDISNWCISNKSGVNFVCFTPNALNVTIHMPGFTYATISSDNFATANNYKPDFLFLTTNKSWGSIVAGSDTIKVVDANGTEIDEASWSTTLSGGQTLQRLIDTNNPTDFQKTNSLTIPFGSLEEWVTDACKNIEGVQEAVPKDYIVDKYGMCILPPVDLCLNLAGVQTEIPEGYKSEVKDVCMLDLLPLSVAELLTNPIGDDDGNEFIEIYNPNNVSVDLANYQLNVTSNGSRFNFPGGTKIEPGEYLSFSNNQIKFSLINTTSSIEIRSTDDQLIDETGIYTNPGEGLAWALIDGLWQYTKRPTPGSANMLSLVEPESEVPAVNNLTPCAVNQYRSPETNRCRLLVVSTSTLAPCKDGQYRSEETNRCRSIASDVNQLMPCAEGQERNPATNRCRSTTAVLGANNLTPCKAGQERNPDTNRCRNVAGTIPTADYAPQQANESSNNSIIMWSLISVGAIAICYGIWEWRQEIIGFAKKIRMNISGKT